MSGVFFLRGLVSGFILVFNTLFWFVPIMLLAVIKVALPFNFIRVPINKTLDGFATVWITVNGFSQRLLGCSHLLVSGGGKLNLKGFYMVTANHQSWVDILILQRVFNRQIPFIKFFLKQALIWVPFIGLAWWALDFPFMKRYSQAQLKARPELKGKDIEVTRKACEKYQYAPVAIMNFLEGTRFTRLKHEQQGDGFQALLKPKAGGLSFALTAMGGKLEQLVDVTIVYPGGIPTMWDYLCGRVSQVKVHIRLLPISSDLLGDYQQDAEYRAKFQAWVNDLWKEKDHRIQLLTEGMGKVDHN
ncbi:acyltransferase [Marinomonas sp.]